MTTHHLKTWPEHFRLLRLGLKTFEARRNDRDFQVGDTLILEEYEPGEGLTGESMYFLVLHILPGGQFGIEPGHCVMSIGRQTQWDVDQIRKTYLRGEF